MFRHYATPVRGSAATAVCPRGADRAGAGAGGGARRRRGAGRARTGCITGAGAGHADGVGAFALAKPGARDSKARRDDMIFVSPVFRDAVASASRSVAGENSGTDRTSGPRAGDCARRDGCGAVSRPARVSCAGGRWMPGRAIPLDQCSCESRCPRLQSATFVAPGSCFRRSAIDGVRYPLQRSRDVGHSYAAPSESVCGLQFKRQIAERN